MKNKGFTLVELIVAIGLSALFLPAIIYVYSFSLRSASQGEGYTQGYALAQEQMEAIYFLKKNSPDWDWTDSSINTNSIEYYQLQNGAGGWILGSKIPKTTLPSEADGYPGYTAIVEVLEVRRDSGSIVESGGLIDDLTRKIVITVSWKENGVPVDIDLISYVSKH